MPNLYRLGFVTVVAVLSIGAFATIQPGVEDVDPSAAPTLGVLYAAPAEHVETHPIRSGETLSGVLEQAQITGAELTGLMLGLREHLNPRRVRAGTEVTVRRWHTSRLIRAVDVRLNADTTVRITKQDVTWTGGVVVTPVDLDTVYTSGSITDGRSLYEAVVLDEVSTVPAADRTRLVYTLAEVFEFKLDFTREIQPGDEYRLMYERESRPDGTARSIRILAAELTNQGKPFTAVLFEVPGRRESYYDEKGGSLRRGFTRYPIEFARVTSSFNRSRFHPVLGRYRAHLGTDIGARTGTPVRSTADGTVTFAGRDGGYGNVVVIRHANGYSTRYAHLSRFASGIRAGRKVSLKETIGYVGSTGLATGPHLHYELRKNGQPIDAQKARLPDAPPLEAKHRPAFLELAQQRLELLDRGLQPRYASRPVTDAARGASDEEI